MCQYHHSTWEEPSSYSECLGFVRVSDKLTNMEKALERVIDMLYSKADLDVAKLDDAIGEMCDECDIQMPATLPMIRRSRSELFEMAASMYNQTGTI